MSPLLGGSVVACPFLFECSFGSSDGGIGCMTNNLRIASEDLRDKRGQENVKRTAMVDWKQRISRRDWIVYIISLYIGTGEGRLAFHFFLLVLCLSNFYRAGRWASPPRTARLSSDNRVSQRQHTEPVDGSVDSLLTNCLLGIKFHVKNFPVKKVCTK